MNELSTLQGRYSENEPIRLLLQHDTPADRAEWHILHLEKELMTGNFPVVSDEQELSLPPLKPGSYGIDLILYLGNELAATLSTAVNVDTDTVRYGFLCDFTDEKSEAVATLAKYHITHVQFYDWSWRHDSLIAPTDEYRDMMGKHNSLSVIRNRIAECHQSGMLAMAYGAVYAACKEFRDKHPSWGLYGPDQKPLVFINTFYYMDIDSPWRNHLMRQYHDAVTKAGFDGIHMDTYGEPKAAFTQSGEKRYLRKGLPALIQDTHNALKENGIQPHLIFNNVGTWPVEETKDCPQDAVYMELWPPMDRYHHLRAAVRKAGNHPVVLAAYPAAFRTDEPERALYSQLILSFSIALLGATQLFIGENNAAVTQGYYADYTVLTPEQISRIRSYEDFFVRYGDLLYNRNLEDVTYTHFGGDNVEYRAEKPCSADGEPEKIWITIREDEKQKIIGLINLCGIQDDHWNTGKSKPIPRKDISLHVLVGQEPSAVWFASPDSNSGIPVKLKHTISAHPYGLEISFTVPSLDCCGLIWIHGE